MSRIVSLFLVINCSASLAQEVVLKTKDRDESYEEYFVLIEDKKVKHGSYLKITRPGLNVFGNNYFSQIGNYHMGEKDGLWEEYYDNCNQIEYRGFFEQGVKDSLWTYFYRDGGVKQVREHHTENGNSVEIIDLNDRISAQGSYQADKKVGIWNYFDPNRQLLQKFDFDKDSLLHHHEYRNLENKPLTFIGGDYEMNRYFYREYGFKDIMDKINRKLSIKPGVITIEFEVDENGNIVSKEVTQNDLNNKKLLEHSLKFFDGLNDCWSPKYANGVAQSAKAKIHFELDVQKTYKSHMSEKWSMSSTSMGFDFRIKLESMP